MTTAREFVAERRHAKLSPGEALRIARELQGLTQSALARKAKIPQPALSAFESGREEMGLKRIKALALALDVHPAVIAFPDWKAPVIPLSERTKRLAKSGPSAPERRRKSR